MREIPYCGMPPIPGSVSWNLDPVLIAVLLAGAMAMLWMDRAGGTRLVTEPGWHNRDPARRGALILGWVVLALALISPLCNLSVALFSARVGQHMILTLIAAPLIALGVTIRKHAHPPGLLVPALAFAAALWGWHLPAPYAATFASDAVYWGMQASLFIASVWLWAALRLRLSDRPDAAALAALATAVQMGLLGALLTLAPRPLFLVVHATAATAPWGLSPLEDQQLGGLLMWVPGGLVFTAVCMAGLGLVLRGVAEPGAGGADVRMPQPRPWP